MTTTGNYVVSARAQTGPRRVSAPGKVAPTANLTEWFGVRMEGTLRELRIVSTLASPAFRDTKYLSVFFLVPLSVLIACTLLWHVDAPGLKGSDIADVVSVAVGLSVAVVGIWAGVRAGTSVEEAKVRELARVHGGLVVRYQAAQMWTGVVLSTFLGLLIIVVVKAPQMGAAVALHAPILIVPLALSYLVSFSFSSVLAAKTSRSVAISAASGVLVFGVALAALSQPTLGVLEAAGTVNFIQLSCVTILQSLYSSIDAGSWLTGVGVLAVMIALLQWMRCRTLHNSRK